MNGKLEKKTKRVLSLGVAFFVIGLVFFIIDMAGKNENKKNNLTTKEERVVATDLGLKDYAQPNSFKRFIYGPNELNPQNTLNFSGSCSDKYITFLIFPAQFDYRKDPSKAAFNRAIVCPYNNKFEYTINFKDLTTLAEGEYYAFVADQGEGNMWYNPR